MTAQACHPLYLEWGGTKTLKSMETHSTLIFIFQLLAEEYSPSAFFNSEQIDLRAYSLNERVK